MTTHKSFLASLPLMIMMGWGVTACPGNTDTDPVDTNDSTGVDNVTMTFEVMVPNAMELYGSDAPHKDESAVFSVDGHDMGSEEPWDLHYKGEVFTYSFEWPRGSSYTHEVTLEGAGINCAPVSINWDASSDKSMNLSWDADQCHWSMREGTYVNEWGDEYEDVAFSFEDIDGDDKDESVLEIVVFAATTSGNFSTGEEGGIRLEVSLEDSLEDMIYRSYRSDGSLVEDLPLHFAE